VAGLNLSKLGIDLEKYERGRKKMKQNLGFSNSRIDTRPEQLIVALGLSL
jgi:hypothetical protein